MAGIILSLSCNFRKNPFCNYFLQPEEVFQLLTKDNLYFDVYAVKNGFTEVEDFKKEN